jgi:hypothetical protein
MSVWFIFKFILYMESVLSSAKKLKQGNMNEFGSIMAKSMDIQAKISKNEIIKKTQRQEVELHVMFYAPSETDVVVNRLVAYASREELICKRGEISFTNYAHVELSFPVSPDLQKYENGYTMAFSVTQRECVFLRKKHWREEYETVCINVSIEDYRKLYNICERLSLQKIKFDKYGMYAASIAPDYMINNRTRTQCGTFCSKIIVEVLQEARVGSAVILTLVSYRSSPNSIYKALCRIK